MATRDVLIKCVCVVGLNYSLFVSSSEGRFPERTANETSVAEDDAFWSVGNPQAVGAGATATTTTAGAKNKKSAAPPWMETVKSLVPASFSGKVYK